MSKVLGVHVLELRPGVDAGEFERFVREKFLAVPLPPGWKIHLLKGDRGERAGQYAMLIEIESVATRDRYYPGDAQPSAETRAMQAQQPAFVQAAWERLNSYTTRRLGVDTVYTDYVELEGWGF